MDVEDSSYRTIFATQASQRPVVPTTSDLKGTLQVQVFNISSYSWPPVRVPEMLLPFLMDQLGLCDCNKNCTAIPLHIFLLNHSFPLASPGRHISSDSTV